MAHKGYYKMWKYVRHLKRKHLKRRLDRYKIEILVTYSFFCLLILCVLIFNTKLLQESNNNSATLTKQLEKIDQNIISLSHELDAFLNTNAQEVNSNTDSLIINGNKQILYSIKQLKRRPISNVVLTQREILSILSSISIKLKNINLLKNIFTIIIIISVLAFFAGSQFEKNEQIKNIATTTFLLSLCLRLALEVELSFESKADLEPNPLEIIVNLPKIDTVTVWPFNSGLEILGKEGISTLDRLKEVFSNSSKVYSEIAIYGGVDKRPLRGRALRIYGDNLSLAQARANSIKTYLQDSVLSSINDPFFVIGVNGANNYNLEYDSILFSRSRSVIVVGRYIEAMSPKNY